MSQREFLSKVHDAYVITATAAGTGTSTGTYIDRQGYAGVLFVISKAAAASSTLTVTVLTSTATSAGATATGTGLVTSDSLTGAGARAIGTTTASALTGVLDYHGSDRYVTCKYSYNIATGTHSIVALCYGAMKTPAA